MSATERWILLGDSIQSEVLYSGTQPVPVASNLTASQIPGLANVVLQNISSPGMRVSQGGQPGTGAYANMNAIGLVSGYNGAKGIVITLGTNDWSNPGTTGGEFSTDYAALINYCKSLGLVVVCVSPIFRSDEEFAIQHSDASYSLGNFRTTVQGNASNCGASFIDGTQFPGWSSPSTLYADGIHLNQAGHNMFAPWLVAAMQALGFWTGT